MPYQDLESHVVLNIAAPGVARDGDVGLLAQGERYSFPDREDRRGTCDPYNALSGLDATRGGSLSVTLPSPLSATPIISSRSGQDGTVKG